VRQRILQDLVNLAAEKPTVAANMDPRLLDEALRTAKQNLNDLSKMRPSPEVKMQIEDAKYQIERIQGLINGIQGKEVTIRMVPDASAVKSAADFIKVDGGSYKDGGIVNGRGVQYFANGGILGRVVKHFATGGLENHVAQIQRAGGPVRVWAEPETKAEAYIPYAQAKRPRSLAILARVAKDFGYTLSMATDSFANGGLAGHATGPTTTNSASVSIGNLYTVDADEAVRKIRNSQHDALAVAGITLNGA
jgi:hypothetical protein